MAHPYAVETLEPQTPTSPGYPLTQNSPRRSPRNTSELDAGRLLPSPASSKRFRTLHRASSTPFLDKEGAVSPTTLHQASAMERGASEGPRNVAPTSFSASVRAKFGLKLGGHSASGPSDGESGSVECSPYSTAPSLSHSRGGSPTESNDSLALTPVPSPSPSPAPVHSPGYNDVPVLEIPDAEQASRRKGLFRLRNAASSASLGRSFKAHKSPRGEIPPLPGSMNAAEDSFLPDLPKASSRGSKAAAKARKSAAAGATDHSRNANDQGGVSEEPPSEVTGGTRSRGMFRGMWSTFKPTKQILTSDSNDGHVSPFKSSFQVDFRGGFDVDVRPAEPERRVSEPLAPTIASSESTSDAASEHIDAAERMAVMMEKSNTLPLGAPTTEPSTSVLGSNSLGLDIRTARGNTKGGGSSPAPSSPAAASSSITLPTLAHPFAFVSPTDASTPSGHAATPQAASESVMASPAQPSTPRRTVLKSPASSAAKLSTPAPALRTPTQTSRTPPPTQARVGDARDIQSALRSLPPLLSLYDDVKAAMCSSQDGAGYNKAGKRSLNIWQRLDAMEGRRGVKILSVTSSKDAVPKSWVGYMRAYSRGDIDISSPPTPRAPPLVSRALPRNTNAHHQHHAESFSSASSADVLGLDLGFPQPPARENDGRASPAGPPSRLESMQKVEEDQSKEWKEVEEVAAVGGEGDIRAPRPVFERERQAAVNRYRAALGLDVSSLPVRSVGLTSIVERLAGELGVAYAAVNLLSEDDAFVLAQAGLDERARISLELCDPDMLADDHREAVNREMPTALSRDRTLDAHVILNRGQLVLLPDLAEDFRFYSRTLGDNSTSGAWAYSSGNEAARMPFYAGQAVLSPDGLPIGTVCVMDATPHSRLPREDMDRIAAAALEVGRELERLRNGELKRSLEGLDHSLSLFASQAAELERTRAQESRSESAAEASPGIETVLLQPDLNEPPLSAGQEKSTAPSLAARRGAPVPARLGLGPTISSQIGNPVPQRHSQHRVLELALQTITRSLATELAYIAIVGSDPLSCTPVVTHFRTEAETSRLRLDAPLHLSALTASKKGLLLGNEPVRVGGLLGIGRKEWKSALVVPCGLKEGGRSWRGTEGWTLAIATKDERKVFGPETTLYLKRFASLLGPLLLGGPRSPSSPAFSLPPNMPLPPLPTRTSSGAHRRTSQAPSVASEETEVSPPRPSKSPHRPRRTALLGAEAILAATACSSPGLASTVSSPRGSLASRDHHLSPRSPSPVARRSPSPVPSPTSSLNRADTRGGSLSPVFGRRNLPALSPPPCSPPPPTPPPTCPLPLPPPGASSRATSPMPSPVTARANASPIAEEVEVLLDTPQLEREMGTSTSLSKSKGQSVSPDSSFMEMPPFAATATMA